MSNRTTSPHPPHTDQPMTFSAPHFLRSAGIRAGVAVTVGAAVLIAGVTLGGPSTDRARPVTETPTLAQMNAAGDHVLGATVHGRARRGPIELTDASFPPGIPGLDVSGWQEGVNWGQVAADGAKFAYVKATEGADYTNSQYASQWAGAASVGLYRGAYHFAIPSESSGGDQARFFLSHGGVWAGDGKTLPPLLDIEYNPNGAACYGLSPAQMVAWVTDFANTVTQTVGRPPALYTTADWWSSCTGNSPALGSLPLVLASYIGSAGPLPAGWATHTIWQYNDHGVFPGDQDTFNGTPDQLADFARGPAKPKPAPVAPAAAPVKLTTQPTAAGADFTGDGTADLITRRPDGTVWLYSGVGSTTADWRAGTEIAAGWNGYDTLLSIGDLTGDGDNDLLARRTDGTLWLYPGTGTAAGMNSVFGKPVSLGSGWGRYRQLTAAGDVDNDGHPDLLGLKPNGTLWLFHGTNTGDFAAPVQVPGDFTAATQLVGAGDISGDKRTDLVATRADGTAWLYRGNGDGTWLPPVQMPGITVPNGAVLIPVGDTNGDHHADLLERATDGTLHLLTGEATPQQAFTGATAAGTVAGAARTFAGDVNGDHLPDLITTTGSGAAQVALALPRGGYQQPRTVIASGFNGYAAITAGDVTGNGITDLVGITSSGDVWLYPGDGHGSFTGRTRIATGVTGAVAAAIADVDHDGRPDLLTQDSDGTLMVYAGVTPSTTDQTRFTVGEKYADGLDAYRPALTAIDANGDGITDLVTASPDGTLWLTPGTRGTGDSHFADPVKIGTGWSQYSTITSAGDPRAGHSGDLLTVTAAGTVSVHTGTNLAGIPGGTLTDAGTVGDRLAIFQ